MTYLPMAGEDGISEWPKRGGASFGRDIGIIFLMSNDTVWTRKTALRAATSRAVEPT
jgi:hypothetical protein